MGVLLFLFVLLIAAPFILYALPLILYVLPFIVAGLAMSYMADRMHLHVRMVEP